jgi:heterotetrameric sarcosine oxidase gamma subunit
MAMCWSRSAILSSTILPESACVAETANLIVSALDGVVTAGRHGRRTGDAGVIVGEARGAGLAAVTARKGQRGALDIAARSAFGIDLPDQPRRVEEGDTAFVWCGPDQWLACRHPAPAEGMEAMLAPTFGGLAAIVDQSHGRTLLRIAGPRAREALAKGIAIDLHPRAFMSGYAALTTVAHIGVHLWQIDDCPTYEFAVPRGFAPSFWHWLEASASEFGLEYAGAEPAGPPGRSELPGARLAR